MSNQPRVAYFCMEYGLHESLPIYSGGLGVLAGDMMKSVRDLEKPVTGIGIFWAEGYTVQRFGEDGHIVDEYPSTPRDALEATGVKVSVTIEGRDVELEAHRVTRHGPGDLLLLEPTRDEDRWITKRLYGGGARDRVAQEIVLGIGGVRLLGAMGIEPDVYHFNEGHAVFAGVELIGQAMKKGASFDDALGATRKQVVFTTHTPVKAGNEVHSLDLLEKTGAFGDLSRADMVRLGGDPFGMTVCGLRLARIANAVAELHGETARRMWADVAGGADIVAITNGVHAPTWQDAEVQGAAGEDEALWSAHQRQKRALLDEIRSRTGVELAEDRLLVGFARRAATYKRADLVFRHPEPIEALLAEGRLQFVFAGKAHPADAGGKELIARVRQAQKRWPKAVLYLENYDMQLGRLLTRGCDVWMNNPRRPMEASGTSGMKAAMNGVLNMSVLDGWWPEGCVHGETGWQVGEGYEGHDQDERDRQALLSTLTGEVVPTYYERPDSWRRMMRASIAMSQERFSSDRMLRDYYEKMYRAS